MIWKHRKNGSAPLLMSVKAVITAASGLLFILCLGNSRLPAAAGDYLNVTSITPAAVSYEGSSVQYTYTLQAETDISGKPTDIFFTFSAGNSGNFQSRILSQGSDTLQYQLYKDSSQQHVLKSFDTQITSDNVLVIQGVKKGTYSVNYVLSIPEGQQVPSGSYMDSVSVKGFIGTLNTYEEKVTKAVTYAVTVPSNVNIAVIPSGGAIDFSSSSISLDFGQLPGTPQTFDTIVEASVPYSIAVRSSNGGKLVNVSNSASTSTAPYTFTFDNQEIPISSTGDVTVVSSPQPSQGEGDRYPVSVQVLDFDTIDPGIYQDVLTFTIQAD